MTRFRLRWTGSCFGRGVSGALALLDQAPLGKREQERDRGDYEHDRDAGDDQQGGEGRARRGGVVDGEHLGEQVWVLGDAPAPDDGGDGACGEDARPTLGSST